MRDDPNEVHAVPEAEQADADDGQDIEEADLSEAPEGYDNAIVYFDEGGENDE
jgi:hypothetical protein